MALDYWVGKLARMRTPWEVVLTWHSNVPKGLKNDDRIQKVFRSRLKYLEARCDPGETVPRDAVPF